MPSLNPVLSEALCRRPAEFIRGLISNHLYEQHRKGRYVGKEADIQVRAAAEGTRFWTPPI